MGARTNQVDVGFEETLDEVRRRVQRMATGRLFIEIHRLQGATIECRIHEDRSTERDIERIMQEPPQPRAVSGGTRARRAG